MFCRNCGQPLEDGVAVCTGCGTEVDNETKANPVVTQAATRDSGNKKEQESNVFLILSIIALGFRATPVISLIFSIISMVKVNKLRLTNIKRRTARVRARQKSVRCLLSLPLY